MLQIAGAELTRYTFDDPTKPPNELAGAMAAQTPPSPADEAAGVDGGPAADGDKPQGGKPNGGKATIRVPEPKTPGTKTHEPKATPAPSGGKKDTKHTDASKTTK
jgi:hypothetical protein